VAAISYVVTVRHRNPKKTAPAKIEAVNADSISADRGGREDTEADRSPQWEGVEAIS
jgi:hypothetical protein